VVGSGLRIGPERFPEGFEERFMRDRGYEFPGLGTLGRRVNRARRRAEAPDTSALRRCGVAHKKGARDDLRKIVV
jgi:hypothetical protein